MSAEGLRAYFKASREIDVRNILDRVTGNKPAVTDYIFVEAAARCPNCRREINEKTPRGDRLAFAYVQRLILRLGISVQSDSTRILPVTVDVNQSCRTAPMKKIDRPHGQT